MCVCEGASSPHLLLLLELYLESVCCGGRGLLDTTVSFQHWQGEWG